MNIILAENCTVCGEEHNSNELKSIILANKTVSKFKICDTCLAKDDPRNDYAEVKKIVDSYLRFEEIIVKL